MTDGEARKVGRASGSCRRMKQGGEATTLFLLPPFPIPSSRQYPEDGIISDLDHSSSRPSISLPFSNLVGCGDATGILVAAEVLTLARSYSADVSYTLMSPRALNLCRFQHRHDLSCCRMPGRDAPRPHLAPSGGARVQEASLRAL